MSKHTKENCRTLAREVIEGMELDTLIEHATEQLEDVYRQNEIAFNGDWAVIMGEELD